ncbi:MAG: c-type cytochrome [Steroidobacteraceae bacterium]|jgi:hypothetical protein
MNRGAAALAAALIAGSGAALAASGDTPAVAGMAPAAAAVGVENPDRAWQHWTLNCQGCHRPDGHGSPGAAPDIAGAVAKFLRVGGGRDYLGRVPGVATSPLANNDLAEVLNWMLWRFDAADIPANFKPYTADEIGRLRAQPLRTEASQMRRELLAKMDRSASH